MPNISRFTDRARRALTAADRAAVERAMPTISRGCLLAGILAHECTAVSALISLGVRDKMAARLLEALGPPTQEFTGERLRTFAAESERVLDRANRIGAERGGAFMGHFVTTEDLLVALIDEQPSMFGGLVTSAQVRAECKRLIGSAVTDALMGQIETADEIHVRSVIKRFFTKDGTGACTRSIWVRYDWREGHWEARFYTDRGLRDAKDLATPAMAISAQNADLVIAALQELTRLAPPDLETTDGKADPGAARPDGGAAGGGGV